MPFVYSNTIFGILLHMWPVLGGPKIEKYNFGNIQNGWQWPKGSLKEKVQKTKKVHSQWVTPEVCQIVWPQVKIWFTRAKKLIFRFSASGVLKSYKIGYYTPPRNVFLKWAIKNQIVPFICLNLTHWPLVTPGTLLMLVVDPPPPPLLGSLPEGCAQ